jgi:hypothetical protein
MIESQITLQIQLPNCRYQPLHKQQVAYKSAVPAEHDDIRGNYNSSVTYSGSDACDKAGISALGINGPSTIYKNQTFE